MNEKINDIIALYCEKEMTDFKASSIYEKLNTLIKEFNLLIECENWDEKIKKCENIYLIITIFDEKNKMIEIYDEGFLTANTILVSRDKKDRYKFYSWKDNEFIDDINWIIEQIKKCDAVDYLIMAGWSALLSGVTAGIFGSISDKIPFFKDSNYILNNFVKFASDYGETTLSSGVLIKTVGQIATREMVAGFVGAPLSGIPGYFDEVHRLQKLGLSLRDSFKYAF